MREDLVFYIYANIYGSGYNIADLMERVSYKVLSEIDKSSVRLTLGVF